MTEETVWPQELRVSHDRRTLTVSFDDGACFALPAELLRVESPSAEVQGHGPGQKQLVAGKRSVGIADIVPTGNYAVRIVFDDGHETGIFTWHFLRTLGEEKEKRLADYQAELAAEGLQR